MVSFYRTYKELKHERGTKDRIERLSFYRTNKELKHDAKPIPSDSQVGFYRTYKELKLQWDGTGSQPAAVFIVPIRN